MAKNVIFAYLKDNVVDMDVYKLDILKLVRSLLPNIYNGLKGIQYINKK